MEKQTNRKRTRTGTGTDIAGLAMAIILATRVLGPVGRSLGQGGRTVLLAVMGILLPVALGVGVWRRRRDERRRTEARLRWVEARKRSGRTQ
jgi:hypothetical protein